ncbi:MULTISPECIES: DUF1129 family protein [Paenibacillus]|uniref:DUF1129 domain-containing protein n=2 Tax=Paenibacillus TaxID=44249 RepID=A0ABQ4MA76_9BACL|nr:MULTISPECIES: DUF1129 family protein [Paenibacillus]MBQ4900332.1 DUF1129 family protein [Paenibacillus sp. Marseille-P2973]MDN4066727.1 DUF1129 family protein [Paenibacillus vini]GIP52896.1 hypothetical protein J42TS3_19310 [Paenibacillus vini]
MYIHEMIHETKTLRQRMTPANEAYFGEMVMYIRSGSSSLTEAKGEEVLLGLARQIIKNQDKGITAAELFGTDAAAYCEQLVDDVNMRKPRSTKDKIKYYTMIPWVALTWVFFIYMITGFFSKWFGGELEYTLISSASLLLIAALSIVLMELVTRFLGPGSRKSEQEQTAARSRKFDPKALGVYLAVAVGLVAIGLLLGRIMPSFTVSPWDSLIIFVIGILGQKFIFGRRTKS